MTRMAMWQDEEGRVYQECICGHFMVWRPRQEFRTFRIWQKIEQEVKERV